MGVSTISFKPTNAQLYLIASQNITEKLHMIYFKSKLTFASHSKILLMNFKNLTLAEKH